MSDIHFSADLDTAKLDAAIKDSNKTVGDWAKNVEKAGGQADQSFNKIGASVEKQKELIKSLSDEMDKVWQSMKSTRGDAGGLQELTKKLSDLRTKRDEATTALEKMNSQQGESVVQTEKEVVSKGSLISSLGKWAAGLFSIAAVLKIVKDVIASTEGTANKFSETVGLLKGGFEGLYRTIATGQWDQLITNIVNAAKATRDLKAATNELTHIVAGGTIERADLLAGLEKARATAAATTNMSERKKYLDQAIDFQKQITELNVSEIKARLIIDEDYYFKLTGHSKEYYDYLLTQIPIIAKNYETLYSQQEGYQLRLNELKSAANNQVGGLTKALVKERHELQLLVFTLEDYKILQDDLSKKGQWDEYIKGIGEMRTAAAQGDQALVYLNRQSATAGKAAAKEVSDLNKQIADQEALFQKAAADGDTAEALRIKGRIDLLQKELDLRINIVKAAILKDAGGVIPIITQLPGAPTVSTRPTSGSAVLSGESRDSQYIPGTAMLTDAAKAKQKKDGENEKKNLKEQLELRKEIGREVSRLVVQLGQSLGMSEKDLNQLGNAVESFSKLASGDFVGAAASMLSNLIAMIPNEAEKFKSQIDAINLALQQQQRLIDQSARTGGTQSVMEENILMLKQKEIEILKALNYAAGQGRPTADLVNQLVDVRNSIEDAKQALDDFLRGGITENTLADSIAQGFKDGKTSVDDFAGYLNTELTDAITNIFTQQLLNSPQMKTFAADLKTFMEDQVLTPEEVAKLRQDQLNIVDANKPNWDALTQGLDLGGSAAKPGLSGQIAAQMTEDTGSELAGLFRRFADDERLVRDYSKQGVNHLVGIENNTFQTVVQLQLAVVELRSIVTNTKPLYAGTL